MVWYNKLKKMKRNSIFYLLAIVMVTVFSAGLFSCNSDNEESNTDGSKRLTRIVSEDIDTNGVSQNHGNVSLSYDSEGRVVSYVNSTQAWNYSDIIESRYQYGDDFIFNEEIEDRNTGYSQSLVIERHRYSLENGLIVADSITRTYDRGRRVKTYSYDDEKRLVAITTKSYGGSVYTTKFVWEDGNLIEMKDDSSVFSYDYTTLPWKKGVIADFRFVLDVFLWDAGYFGKRSENLLSKFEYRVDNSNIYGQYSYEYGFSNGLVSEIIERRKSYDGSIYKFVSTLLWE